MALDADPIEDTRALRERLSSIVAGDRVSLSLERDGEVREVEILAAGRALEQHADCEVVYSELCCSGHRLRTIVTSPANPEASLPYVLFIQGHGAGSMDSSAETQRPIPALAAAFARAGFVFVRFDRTGVGDSEGPPQSSLGLADELDQVSRAWSYASGLAHVAPERGILLAHSLGAVPAIELSVEASTRPAGLIVYGGGLKLWTEYSDENCRRQWTLAGVGLVEQDRALRALARFHALLLVQRRPLTEVFARLPEIQREPELYGIESDQVLRGRPYTYWQDLYDAPLAERLQTARIPVLAAWGTADWVSSRADHELLANCVEEAHPGFGTFNEISGADHNFAERASTLDAYHAKDAGRLSEQVPHRLLAWAAKVTCA